MTENSKFMRETKPKGRYKLHSLNKSIVIRTLVTVVLLAALFYYYDVKKSLSLINIDLIETFFIGCGIGYFTLALNAYRWYLIVTLTKSQINFTTANSLTLIGHFFNQILPTSVGGDVLRGWEAHKSGMQLECAVVSVILDRLVGLGSLLLLVIFTQPFLAKHVTDSGFRLLSLGLLVCSISGLLLLFLFHRLPLPFERFKFLRISRKISLTARQLLSANSIALTTTVISISMHTAALLTITIFAHDVGVNISFYQITLVAPTVFLLSALPISIGGWGVREAGLAAGFLILGYPAEEAITISLLVGFTNLVLALPGAFVWLLRSQK